MTLKKTALNKIHHQLSAKLASFANFEMPIQYKNIKEEIFAVRNNAGIFDVSHMGEFLVTGNGATSFVDYLLTNDYLNLPIHKAVYSPLCNNEGKIIDDLIAYKLNEHKSLVCVNASNIEKDWDWIMGHAAQFDCQVEDISNQTALVALQGPNSEKILIDMGILPSDLKLPYYGVTEVPFNNEIITLSRTGYTGEDGFEIFTSNESVASLWNTLTADYGVVPCGLAARDVLRLEACYPLYGNELSEELTPLDTGLKWTVNMKKGKFLGKSALENYCSEYQLVKLATDEGIPRKDYSILNSQNETIGRLTSGTFSTTIEKGISMGLIKQASKPQDEKYFIQIRNKIIPAVIYKKNFLTGDLKK